MKDERENQLLHVSKFGSHEFVLTGMSGETKISYPYSFQLEVLSDEDSVDAKLVVGKACSFKIARPDDSFSEFHGKVWRLEAAEVFESDPPVRVYRMEVVPDFKFLSLSKDSRIFQEKTPVEIVEQVLKDHAIDFKISTKGAYAKMDFCVQWRESDFDFASRLMADFGIFYYFTHEASKNTLVLADAASGYHNIAEDQVEFGTDTESAGGEVIDSWRRSIEMVTSKVVNWDYDFENPSETLEVAEKTKLKVGAEGEVYDYPGRHVKVADGKPLAVAQMEAWERKAVTVHGTSRCTSFTPGGKFTITSHPADEELDQKYALVSVRHAAQEPYLFTQEIEHADYRNSFECVPADIPYRPDPPANRPQIVGPQPAIVVGPKGTEIHTDKYGRIRVQFPWDREGKMDDKSSCWLRVSQDWAGKQWGSFFLPRVGQEVLVEFLNGDPNRPIVTGRVYNADNMPPADPLEKATQSGIKTQSTDKGKATDFHQLLFDDKIGAEFIYFHSQKDFVRVVENNDGLEVGYKTGKHGDGDGVNMSGEGCQFVKILGDRDTVIEKGKDALTLKAGDQLITLDKGNQTITIKQGNHKLAVTAGESVIEAAKSITLKVGSSSIKIDPMGITLDATKITAKAKLKAEVKGVLVDVVAGGVLTLKGGLVKVN